MLYVFACEATAGPDLEFSRKLEAAFASNPAIELSRQFACEKVCLERDQLLRRLPHRSALDKLLGDLERQATLKPMLVVVDPSGDVIARTEKPLDAVPLQGFMKRALEECKKRFVAAKPVGPDPP